MAGNEKLIQAAKSAESPEALRIAMCGYGLELTQEEAERYFSCVHSGGELSDDELDNVSGGGCGNASLDGFCGGDRVVLLHEKCPSCGATTVRYNTYTVGNKKTGDPGYPFYLSMQCDCGTTFTVKNFGDLTNSMRKA